MAIGVADIGELACCLYECRPSTFRELKDRDFLGNALTDCDIQ
jgi:hypothetical protein